MKNMTIEQYQQSTGSKEIKAHTATYSFENFEVTVNLGPSNEFLGVKSIAVKKDFLSLKQRLSQASSFNVDDLYEEE